MTRTERTTPAPDGATPGTHGDQAGKPGQPIAQCPPWCRLRDELDHHDGGLAIQDGVLRVYVSHEVRFPYSDDEGYLVEVTYYDDGGREIRLDFDRLDQPVRDAEELRAIARGAEAAAAFVEALS